MTAERVAAAIETIRTILAGYVFRVRSEAELQDGVSGILRGSGITVARELRETAGRLDILAKVAGPDDQISRIVIELKLNTQASAAERQAQRYAMMPDVDAVIVVTTSKRLAFDLNNNGGPTLGGKPFCAIAVRTT